MKVIIITLLVTLVSLGFLHSASPGKEKDFPQIMRFPGWETEMTLIEAEVLRVYSVNEGPYRFRAYTVKWNEEEIVANDLTAETDFEAGDIIKVIVQKTKLGDGTATISFFLPSEHEEEKAEPDEGGNSEHHGAEERPQ